MNEIRKDYALDRWVIIAEKRKARPHQFSQAAAPSGATDFFAPGNEELTPKEIGRVQFKGSWLMRWFSNKFPAMTLEKAVKKSKAFKMKKGFFTSTPAYGHHEVIVETPTKNQLWDLSEYEISELLQVYALRIDQLMKEKDVAYVSLFKNHGSKAGTSLLHSHSQLITTPIIPSYIKEKAKAYKSSTFTKIINQEQSGPRHVKDTKTFFAFCPYASRFNFETWIFPKKHKKSLSEFTEKERNELAKVLKKVLGNLKTVTDSFNILIFHSPKGVDLRFHIEIIPRNATWAGFEYASGIIINSVAPETAAQILRR
ncbi:MAG: DUF4931 domain-containing protein [Candidatus Woesearchaeota archaeon]|jgi:UDPglucose--hexose-1-phosphate uridylyltransferase|nr:DUF4931 domain-containing protein [Candidatus Woesearchaeota archaeon]MDP7324096.1 DUF4931 domain-containing protein [Candidatus Woesearchaeota archaeon]MDP7458005.1 DUF4931 domain-containing protein [Candidatus Woesearchaeota archaeon]